MNNDSIILRYSLGPYAFGLAIALALTCGTSFGSMFFGEENSLHPAFAILPAVAAVYIFLIGARVYKHPEAVSLDDDNLVLTTGLRSKTLSCTVPLGSIAGFRLESVSENYGNQALRILMQSDTPRVVLQRGGPLKEVGEDYLFYPGQGMTRPPIPQAVAILESRLKEWQQQNCNG